LERFQPGHFHQIGKDAEISRSARDVESGSERNWLARIRDFGLNETIEPFFNRVRDAVQSRCSLADSEVSPFSVHCPPGRVHRLVHLSFVGFRNLSDHRSICGAHIGKLALPAHEAAIDIILD
jgi:hypothetical protein